jgi:hypothetical protein
MKKFVCSKCGVQLPELALFAHRFQSDSKFTCGECFMSQPSDTAHPIAFGDPQTSGDR